MAFKRAWESFLHHLNIAAGGKVASRSRPKLQVIDNLTPHMLRHPYVKPPTNEFLSGANRKRLA